MDEQLKNKFDEWFSGDKKQKLFLANGEITILARIKENIAYRLEIKVFFDDDQVFFYNILLDKESTVTSFEIFSEIIKGLDDFLKNQCEIVKKVKSLIGGEN
jgi:hypothetical protein